MIKYYLVLFAILATSCALAQNASDSDTLPPTQLAPLAPTPVPLTTPPPAPTARPMAESVSLAAEGRARGVLTVFAVLFAPFIGPSAIFDVSRSMAVFTFARCSHQGEEQVVIDASTSAPTWPEAVIPLQAGGANSGWLRGTLVSNLFIVPLIILAITLPLGWWRSLNGGDAGKWTPPAASVQYLQQLQHLNAPAWKTTLVMHWLTICEWMYYGSTMTALTMFFAVTFDGSIAAIFSIFKTSLPSDDDAGDFVLAILYMMVVFVFLYRVASTIYRATPARCFITPAIVVIKKTKRRGGIAKGGELPAPPPELPWCAAWVFSGIICRVFIAGDYTWRPGSKRSYCELRETAALFRRQWGPDDDDRSEFAAAALALADLERARHEKMLEAMQAQKLQQQQLEAAEAEQQEQQAAASAGDEAEEGEAAKNSDDAAGKKKSKPKQNKKDAGPEAPKAPSMPWNFKLLFRRLLCADFFFFEFIFVFFISAFRGAARVATSPDACYGLARASAAFQVLFLIFVLAVRPFLVPFRNFLAVTASAVATAASFTLLEVEAAAGAADLAVLSAVMFCFAFLFIGIPRLLMRFFWQLQHAPGRHVPLASPQLSQEERDEIARRKLEQEEHKRMRREERRRQRGASMVQGDDKGQAMLLFGEPDEPDDSQRYLSALGVTSSPTGDGQQHGGALSRLAHVFFPPPAVVAQASNIDGELCDSFGEMPSLSDDDDDLDSDDDITRFVMSAQADRDAASDAHELLMPAGAGGGAASTAGGGYVPPPAPPPLPASPPKRERASRYQQSEAATRLEQRIEHRANILTHASLPRLQDAAAAHCDSPMRSSPSSPHHAAARNEAARKRLISQQTALSQLLVHIADQHRQAERLSTM